MQKISMIIFVGSSVAFGLFGVLVVITSFFPDDFHSRLNELFLKLLSMSFFVMVPSLVLSLAGKYLNNKSK